MHIKSFIVTSDAVNHLQKKMQAIDIMPIYISYL